MDQRAGDATLRQMEGDLAQPTIANSLLCYLTSMRRKVPKDDLVEVVCGHYTDDAISAARDLYYKAVPPVNGSRIRRRAVKDKKVSVAIILDLMHETPSDVHPPFVCMDITEAPSRDIGTVDNVALHHQVKALLQEVQCMRVADRGLPREFCELKQDQDMLIRLVAEQRSILDSMMARHSVLEASGRGRNTRAGTGMAVDTELELSAGLEGRALAADPWAGGVEPHCGSVVRPPPPPSPPPPLPSALEPAGTGSGAADGGSAVSSVADAPAGPQSETMVGGPAVPSAAAGYVDTGSGVPTGGPIVSPPVAAAAAGPESRANGRGPFIPPAAAVGPVLPTPEAAGVPSAPSAAVVPAEVGREAPAGGPAEPSAAARPAEVGSGAPAVVPAAPQPAAAVPEESGSESTARVPSVPAAPPHYHHTLPPAVATPTSGGPDGAKSGSTSTGPAMPPADATAQAGAVRGSPACGPAIPEALDAVPPGTAGRGVRREEGGESYASILALSPSHRPTTLDLTSSASTSGSSEGGNGGFQRQKRRHNKPRPRGSGTGAAEGPPVRTSRGLGWGKRPSGPLGAPTPCQVLVRYLPWNFPAEELQDYVKALLQDDGVEVQTLWRRDTAAFVVAAARRHFRKLLSEESWDSHVHVKPYFTREGRRMDTPGSSDVGYARGNAREVN